MLGRILIFLAALAVWLIVLLPLKTVAIAAGGADRLGYQDVFGTVWNGRVYGLELAGEPVREIALSMRPAALLTGQAAADWLIEDASLSGNGRIALGAGRVEVSGASLVVPLSRLAAADWPGMDPGEPVFVRLPRLVFVDGDCRQADGAVRTGALVTLGAAYGFEGPVLEGGLSCRDGVLALAMRGETDALSVTADADLRANGYDWRVTARTGNADLADALALAGFEAGIDTDGDVWHAQGSGRYDGND